MKRVCLIALIFVFLLAGCGSGTQSDIFALPALPETQKALLDTVDQVCLDGFEYAEPRSGVNRYPVQLVDLDGDGEDEGIVFLRDITDTYKTYIYIFEQSESVFSLFDVIEGPEDDIYTVSYSRMIKDGGYELIVKWGENEEESNAVTAHSLTADGMVKTLDISAKQFSISDISGDGENELLAVTRRNGSLCADIYAERSGKISRIDSVILSKHGGEVTRILSGKVSASVNGVFIERETDDGIVTDVVICKNGEYVNILPDGDVRGIAALCADVNDDGRIELPQETEINDDSSTDRTYLWKTIDASGTLSQTAFTYHSYTDNWYLLLPVSWGNTVFVRREVVDSQKVRLRFYTHEVIDGDMESYIEAPLFNIYVCKGSGASARATDGGNFLISERENMAFSGEIISTGYLGEIINEEFLKDAFKNRKSDWASEILFA